jgi:ribonuclease HII
MNSIGIDEVGRGALAGPVVVAAALVSCHRSEIGDKKLGRLKDSKKLSAKHRELWYAYFLKHPGISFAIARVYPRQIEKKNISGAANLAASRALLCLYKKAKQNKKMAIFLDGGLFLRNRAWQHENAPRAKTVIKADETIVAVSIASIIAKVYRDRLMKKMTKQYPHYEFEIHKGYGTKIHREKIRRFGPCPAHRKSFLTKVI